MWAALPRNVAEKSHTNQNGDAEPERESGRVEVEQKGERAGVPHDLDHLGDEGKGRWCPIRDAPGASG